MLRTIIKFAFICLIPLLFSCKDNKDVIKKNVEKFYDVEIHYRYQMNEGDISHSHPDSLFLLIENSFKDDVIEVKINDEIFFTDTVNTNNITGLAHFYNLGLKKEADHVVFKINNGPRILLDLNFNKEDINSIGIRKYQNKIDVFYYRKKPLFY